jgi:hypothetical protein
MADRRITELDALTAATVSGADLAVLVDVSDTTMSATGTNKKITLTELTAQVTGAAVHNRIMNGGMEIAQRGTSFATIANGTYSLDRWRFSSAATSAAITASQQTDAPSANEFQNSLRLAVTTADTSIAAGDQVNIQQRIEGYNVRDLIGRAFTLSFWVRSSKTGTHCVYFQNSNSDRSYIVEYTVSAANTWEKKTVSVLGGLITAGTWNWTTGIGLIVGWTLAAGTTFQTTANSWQSGNFLGTANQVNCLDANTNIFALTGVQLELGNRASAFEHRAFSAELAMCQRYYWQASYSSLGARYASTAGTWNGLDVGFPVTMRAAPTVTLSNLTYINCSTGTAGAITADKVSISVATSGTATYTLSTATIAAAIEL